MDLDRRATAYPPVTLAPGLVVEHRGSGVVGAVVTWGKGQVSVRDRRGSNHRFPLENGGFAVDGRPVTLVAPRPAPNSAATGGPRVTASGSIAVPSAPARVARESRLLVEGVHDAELLEKVWGDDLRHEGIVVEPIDGIDNLADIVAAFRPGRGRRLGVLVDHLVAGSKESRLAAAFSHPDVLVRGHRFVDVWAAIDPALVGIDRWPDVPRSIPWKQGICSHLGVTDTAVFWKQLVGRVRTYADLDPSLVGAVEELIDFVTEAAGD